MPPETHVAPVLVDGPAPASAREYLRRGLPAVYREARTGAEGDAFAMRFLLALEEVLDPIVAAVDLLPQHLDLDLAPSEVLGLVATWLGLELDASLPDGADRRLVHAATEITRARGTRAGLERVLELAYGRLRLRVADSGAATWGDLGPPPAAAEPALTVAAPGALAPAARAAVRRLVEEVKPANVRFELLEEHRR